MSNLDHYISVDLGTTSVKVILFNQVGDIISSASYEYVLHTPAEDIVELDAQLYWEFCQKGIAQVVAASKVAPAQIKSVGACSQGETLIVVDKDGTPLRRAIVWMDNRARQEARDIENALGMGEVTGQLGSESTWPISKILWLKKNEPKMYRNIYKFLLVEDYIIYRLTGKYRGDYALYTSSFMLDIVKKTWWKDILDYVGITEERLVDLSESGEIVGTVTPSVCAATGLGPETHVVTGAMDQTVSVLGSGAVTSGIVSETTGAALAVCATVDAFPAGVPRRVPVHYHALPDKYYLIGWCPTGGMALKWLRDTFFKVEIEQAHLSSADSFEWMVSQAKSIPPGSQRLIFLPYLAGGGTADVGNEVTGVFHGLGLHHGRAHFIRSVLEAIGFVLRQNIEAMQQMGVICRAIHSQGGGAKSALWNQIKADITGKTVITMKCSEATALGTAMLQAQAVGTYRDLQEADQNMVKRMNVVEPQAENSGVYESLYQRFLEVNEKCANC